MPGFFCEIRKGAAKIDLPQNDLNHDLLVESISDNGFYIERRTIRKFLNDKVFFDDEKYLIVTEGVILNSRQLLSKYGQASLKDTIVKMYEKNGETFFNEFRGSFSGVLYDKALDKWLIYTNHVGSKWVFYLKLEDGVVVASDLFWIVKYMKTRKMNVSLDEFGAYCLLKYGFMLEDYTLIKGVKKIMPGHYLRIEKGTVDVRQYYKIDTTPNYEQKEEEIIENIDRLFKEAVSLQFEKDREYGYRHLVSLSAGLDSRMTCFVAHELGYTEQMNVTYSKTGFYDETVPKQIASDLKHEWIFKSLDNGIHIPKYMEDMIKVNYGLVLFSGSVQPMSLVRNLNFESFGIYHMGLIGDIILGGVRGCRYGNEKVKVAGINEEVYLKYRYENDIIEGLMNNEFNGTLSGNLTYQPWTEVASPFLNVDFMNYALKIPSEYRDNHKMYRKWILRKHRDAAKYIWATSEGKLTEPTFVIAGRKLTIRGLINKGIRKLFYGTVENTSWGMNPYGYWYKSNPELRNWFEVKYKGNIDMLPEDYRNVCNHIFEAGNVGDKTRVLTLLEAWKRYLEV
ncbi:MAG: asparagine synthase [Fervidobacterium sp.]|uniref:asparagine synthase n=1 Tax=Fervidobacterium sp. TaxID=1871331 RepID=UPI0040499072